MKHAQPVQLRLLHRGQGGLDDGIAVVERHLAGGNAAHLRGDPVIDFVSDNQESQLRVFRRGAEVDGLDKDLVKMLPAKPPVPGALVIQSIGE